MIVNKIQFIPGDICQWKFFKIKEYKVWLAGNNVDEKYNYFKTFVNKNKIFSKDTINSFLKNLDDHFGIVCISKTFSFAAVDASRAYPIFWKHSNNNIIFSSQAKKIVDQKKDIIDYNQLTAFRMSGYTISEGSLWKNIQNINAGSFIFINSKNEIFKEKHFSYTPWKTSYKSYKELKKQLADEINIILKNMITKSNGRTIIVPLSAGLDSRLIVSGLKHFDYKKVKCFSYGLKNNFESKMSQLIANKLNYSWKFVEINQKIAKNFYKSSDYKKFLVNSNDGCAISTIQGFYAINKLLQDNYICKEDIIINGNSGDFISGGHVPKKYISNSKNINLLYEEFFDQHFLKHYGLWPNLMNKTNKEIIKDLLFKQLIKNIEDKGVEYEAHGISEFLEYQNRQTKYVINSQRIYEFYNLKWQLPLWDKSFIKFWSNIPLKYKINQKLYRDVLRDLNMGSVWGKEYNPISYVSPSWMRFLRLFLKAYFIFLGKKRWHNFEKKYLDYWMDNICGQSIIPYKNIINSPYVSRHYVSWLAILSEQIMLHSNWQKLDIGNDFKI